MPGFMRRLLQYAMTAGVAAIVDAGGFVLLVNARLSILAAGSLSFGIAALVNYLLTSRFVFHQAASLRGFTLFFAGALVGMTVNVGITLLGVLVAGLPPLAAKLTGIAIAFLVNFLINLRVVFRTG